MLIYLLLAQLAVGHDLTKSNLPVDTTSFCRAMFIDMADKQSITARPNAMLTRWLWYILKTTIKKVLKTPKLNFNHHKLLTDDLTIVINEKRNAGKTTLLFNHFNDSRNFTF